MEQRLRFSALSTPLDEGFLKHHRKLHSLGASVQEYLQNQSQSSGEGHRRQIPAATVPIRTEEVFGDSTSASHPLPIQISVLSSSCQHRDSQIASHSTDSIASPPPRALGHNYKPGKDISPFLARIPIVFHVRGKRMAPSKANLRRWEIRASHRLVIRPYRTV